MRKFLAISLLLIGGFLISSTFARELNSGNINDRGTCSPSGIICNLQNRIGGDGTGITSIATNTFINHSNLEELYMNNNGITGIRNGDFNNITGLITLQIGFNNIKNIESGAFLGFTNLSYLDFMGNQISNIENGTFSELSNLTYLGLRWNKITNIKKNIPMNELSNLQTLDLSDNLIPEIEENAFTEIPNLIELEIGNNQIKNIKKQTFSGLSNLEFLNLEGNQITNIETGDFEPVTNLNILRIYYNCLDTGTLSQETIDLIYVLEEEDNSWIETQYVCVGVNFSRSTTTFQPITGMLTFVGGTEEKRNTLITANPGVTGSYLWTKNGEYSFNFPIVDNTHGFLHPNTTGFTNFTGRVDRIKSYFETCENNPICSRMDVTLNAFDYANARKERIVPGQVYTLNINATNTDTVGNNKVTLPGGHIFTLPQTVNQNESATTTVKIKYFTTE